MEREHRKGSNFTMYVFVLCQNVFRQGNTIGFSVAPVTYMFTFNDIFQTFTVQFRIDRNKQNGCFDCGKETTNSYNNTVTGIIQKLRL